MSDKTRIQEEREKRQSNIAQLNAMIAEAKQQLAELQTALLKNIGGLEQLDELEGVEPAEPSDHNNPVKEEIIEEKQ